MSKAPELEWLLIDGLWSLFSGAFRVNSLRWNPRTGHYEDQHGKLMAQEFRAAQAACEKAAGGKKA